MPRTIPSKPSRKCFGVYGTVGTVAAETTAYSPLLTAARNVMRSVRFASRL
jgi:hypothetical protein